MSHSPMLPGPEPTGPELSPIMTIHRHDDAVVTFHRKLPTGEFENLFGIRSGHLQQMFPQFREQLEQDVYFSINAFWHWESKPNRRTYLSAAQARQSKYLRYLCSCYADIDSYHLSVNWTAAFAQVLQYQEDGIIPPASIIVRSGRGLWLLWLLHDPMKPDRPPRAYAEKLKLYIELQRAIGARLSNLGADVAARDSLRLIRAPGSIHTGATGSYRRVKYWIQAAAGAEPYVYTLDELAEFFGVNIAIETPSVRAAFEEANKSTGNHRCGWAALNARRLREFELLRSMRGGFTEGTRHWATTIYAWLLKCNRTDRATTVKEVGKLGAECTPPFPIAECRGAVNHVFGKHAVKMRDQTIADYLAVTPTEADFLERLPAASRFGATRPSSEPEGTQVNRTQRQQLILSILRRQGERVSVRQMVKLLERQGIYVSRPTVTQDYLALGIEIEKPSAQLCLVESERLTPEEGISPLSAREVATPLPPGKWSALR